MSKCNETFAARGFDSMKVYYPMEMMKNNITRLTVLAEGKEFGEELQVLVKVPLKSFFPDSLLAYGDVEFKRDCNFLIF